MSKTILITGGSGFVGSSLAIAFKKKYNYYTVYSLDNLKRRGSELNLPRLKQAGVNFIHGDIRNAEDIDQVKNADCIIDAAAEPSVLAGLNSSIDYLINTNLNGTINTLKYALKNKSDFIFLSTSRVYPIRLLEMIKFNETETRFAISEEQEMEGISSKGISEKFSTEGSRSLYGSTKLASELFIEEFNKNFDIKTVINRCGVLTGPWQMGKVDQGVVALWLTSHFWKQELAYIGYGGEGKQIRDILYIDDLFDLVDKQVHRIEDFNGETYNVGGSSELTVSLKELSTLCENITGNKIKIKSIKENRQSDVRIYSTDYSKIYNFARWKPKRDINFILKQMYIWIKNNESLLKNIFITNN